MDAGENKDDYWFYNLPLPSQKKKRKEKRGKTFKIQGTAGIMSFMLP